jgi:tetratricopeptide (TPR) repeat protein
MDEASLRAVEIDPRDPRAWDARMKSLIVGGRWDAAFDASDRAIQLDPTDGGLQQARALLLIFTGRLDDALAFARERVARDPSLAPYFRFIECRVLLTKGRYQDAIPVCERNASASVYLEQMFLASLYARAGDLERAHAAKARLLDLAPGFTIAKWRARAPTHPEFQRQLDEHIVPGLRKAGVPE